MTPEQLSYLNDYFRGMFNNVFLLEEEILKKTKVSNISVKEMHTIEAVAYAEETKNNTMKTVADLLSISPGALTTAINTLEKKGYIIRRNDGNDRRLVYVYLTEDGKKIDEIHKKFHFDMISKIGEEIKGEELKSFIRSLITLKKYFYSEITSKKEKIVNPITGRAEAMIYNYEIITDTCSNLTKEQAEKNNIRMMGFPYLINNEEHTDDPENPTFKTEELYELLKEKKSEAKTSLINSAVIEEFLEPYLKAGQDVIYITISGGISGTYKNAVMASENLKEKYPDRKIYIVDSLSGSYAQGILVLKTAKKREEGFDIAKAYDYANSLRNKITHDFTIDDLMYIRRSGRVSNASAILGTLVMIKPIFTLDKNGNLIVSGKVNGRKKALSTIFEHFKNNIDPENTDIISVVHSACEEEALPILKKIKELYPKAEILFDYLTPLVGTHTGPGAVGILYVGKNDRA